MKDGVKRLCVLLLCLTMTTGSVTMVYAEESVSLTNETEKHFPGLVSFLNEADKLEWDKQERVYTFDKLNSTIRRIDRNDNILFQITEGDKQDTLILYNNGEVYLNDKQIDYSYVNDEENIELYTGGYTYSYGTAPNYGKSTDYTHYVKTYSVSNLELYSVISDISKGAFAVLIGVINKPAGIATEAAIYVYDKFFATKTTALSCKTKVYTHNEFSNGYHPTGYCEKHSITWYSKPNYQGHSTTTKEFKNGFLW